MKEFLPGLNTEKIEKMTALKAAYEKGEISLEEAKERMKKEVGALKPHEIAYAEQELKIFDENECRKEDIRAMLELYEDLWDTSRPTLAPDHPIAHYYAENDALRKILSEIEDLVQYPIIKNQWYELYDRLAQFKIHHARKQNQLYAILEKKGFDRPTTTMWTYDNHIRDAVRNARELLDAGREEDFIEAQNAIVADMRDLMEKEEYVLYPTSLSMISDEEFEDMKSGDAEIGYAWINPIEDVAKDLAKQKPNAAQSNAFAQELSALLGKFGFSGSGGGELDVCTGKLTLEQINLIYKHLPVDISYVDENEIVKFYSDTDHRVFPRSKNVIGRDVKNCHPRKSVHIVEEIIEKFRSGEQNTAEFWINRPDLFIYIYYVAVRDEAGNFRGVLEMMQDCTHIRALQGSQTLLNWGNAATQPRETPETPEAKPQNTSVSLTADTMLKDILAIHPWLRDEMEKINPKFKLLKTPMAKLMLPKATVGMMSERGGMPVDELIAGIRKLIESRT